MILSHGYYFTTSYVLIPSMQFTIPTRASQPIPSTAYSQREPATRACPQQKLPPDELAPSEDCPQKSLPPAEIDPSGACPQQSLPPAELATSEVCHQRSLSPAEHVCLMWLHKAQSAKFLSIAYKPHQLCTNSTNFSQLQEQKKRNQERRRRRKDRIKREREVSL